MRKNSDVVRFTKYLVTLPKTPYLLLAILLLNIPLFIMCFTVTRDVVMSTVVTFIISILPVFLGSYLTFRISNTSTLTLKRSMFFGLVDTFFIVACASIFWAMNPSFFGILDGVIFAYGITIAVRTFFFYSSLNIPKRKIFGSVFITSLLGGCFLILLFALDLRNTSLILPLIQKLFFSITIYGFGVWLFLSIINIPFGKGLGISMYELARGFVSTWYDNTRLIENVLEKIAMKRDIPLYLIGFKGKKNWKALFLIPYFHPGPFGDIGGPGLINTMRKRLEKTLNTHVFVFHGAATHDHNPVSRKMVSEVLNQILSQLKKMKVIRRASNPVEVRSNGNTMKAQLLGNTLFVSSTFSPNPTEDVDLGLGIALIKTGEKRHEHCVFVDAHNCFAKGEHAVYPGDPRAYVLLKNMEKISDFKFRTTDSVRLGVASDTLEDIPVPVGPGGLKVAVIETKNTKTAYILLDGNNLEKGFREEILSALKSVVDDAEVFTSDNHVVNVIRGGNNPIPKNKELLKRIVKCVNEAIDDMEPVSIGFAEILIKDLPVFGTNRTGEIVSLIEVTVGLIKVVAPVILIMCSLLSAYVISLIPWV